MLPIIMAVCAAAGFATGGIFARLAGQRVSVLTGTGMSVVASLALAAIPALALELPALSAIPVTGFLWILLLAVVNYPLARTFNYASVRRIGAARASPLFSSSPLWATLLAYLFLGERPNGVIIAGTMAIVAGVVVIVTEGRGNEKHTNKNKSQS